MPWTKRDSWALVSPCSWSTQGGLESQENRGFPYEREGIRAAIFLRRKRDLGAFCVPKGIKKLAPQGHVGGLYESVGPRSDRLRRLLTVRFVERGDFLNFDVRTLDNRPAMPLGRAEPWIREAHVRCFCGSRAGRAVLLWPDEMPGVTGSNSSGIRKSKQPCEQAAITTLERVSTGINSKKFRAVRLL